MRHHTQLLQTLFNPVDQILPSRSPWNTIFLNPNWVLCFILFEPLFYVSQITFKSTMQPRLTLNFGSYCFHLLGTGIKDTVNHTQAKYFYLIDKYLWFILWDFALNYSALGGYGEIWDKTECEWGCHVPCMESRDNILELISTSPLDLTVYASWSGFPGYHF